MLVFQLKFCLFKLNINSNPSKLGSTLMGNVIEIMHNASAWANKTVAFPNTKCKDRSELGLIQVNYMLFSGL